MTPGMNVNTSMYDLFIGRAGHVFTSPKQIMRLSLIRSDDLELEKGLQRRISLDLDGSGYCGFLSTGPRIE